MHVTAQFNLRCLFVSAVHFAPYLAGLSSMMLKGYPFAYASTWCAFMFFCFISKVSCILTGILTLHYYCCYYYQLCANTSEWCEFIRYSHSQKAYVPKQVFGSRTEADWN